MNQNVTNFFQEVLKTKNYVEYEKYHKHLLNLLKKHLEVDYEEICKTTKIDTVILDYCLNEFEKDFVVIRNTIGFRITFGLTQFGQYMAENK